MASSFKHAAPKRLWHLHPCSFLNLIASAIGAPCELQGPFIPRSFIHSILTVVLFWIVWLLAFQLSKQLYAADGIYMGVLFYMYAGQFPAQSPVPRPLGRQGSSWRHSHHSLALEFNTIVANKGPSQLKVITGSWGRLLSFTSGHHSCSEAGTHFPGLGYLQHDCLDDTVDKNITALGSQGWLHPCRSRRAQLQQQQWQAQCSQANQDTPAPRWHCKHSNSRQSWNHPYQAVLVQPGKAKGKPRPSFVCCCCWKQLQCKFYCKTTVVNVWAGQNWSQSLLSLSFSGTRME